MSNVYFSKIFSADKIKQLAVKAGISDIIRKNELVAVKIHFGEKDNRGYIKPAFVKPVVDEIKSLGAKPFLTDTNTIYKGSRTDAVDHILTANEHKFDTCGCPVIIADGLRGNSYVELDVNLKHIKKAQVANDIYYSDKLVFMTHFKGHELFGFGGALKNIGMGCIPRKAKYTAHNTVKPSINIEACIGCGICIKWCPAGALRLSNKKITLNKDICIGCGECILSCEQRVIDVPWDESTKNAQEKTMEFAYGVLKDLPDGKAGKKSIYISFLNHITKFCDCFKTSEGPLIEDIGILASEDPVAIDQASVDLVNKKAGYDFFKKIFPNIDSEYQIVLAEKLGIGSRKYKLIHI
ncbi:MAG: DUF362 domain-containing protein [Elusimicrobia bacterium]|nr:DUF362 domain-containing protein [Elusimicrobiota bacterium]